MEPDSGRKQKMLVIVNPISGTRKKKDLEKKIGSMLDGSRFDYRIVFTENPGHATVLATRAVEEGAEIIIAVGGDGTVNEIGQALIGKETRMGIIPAGSGNGLARHLDIPFSMRKAIETINRGRTIKIDTAVLNDKVFLSVAGIGYDAFVARKFASGTKRGFLTYFRIVSGEYLHYKPKKYWIEIDGKTITRKAFLITFANSNQFGYNTSIAPSARLDDGLVDVCIVRKVPFALLPFYVPRLFTKSFHRTHFIEIIPAKTVHIRRKKGKSIHFDGDPYRMGKELTMTVKPKSLNVIVP
jgi:diacylglycerol kinase (ATP)